MKEEGKHFDTGEIDLSHSDRAEKRIRKRRERRQKQRRVPRWVYRIIVILLVAVAGLLIWFNRDNLTPQNIADWIQERVVGVGIGDGFPYRLGDNTQVEQGNFISVNKEAVFASDTALTVLNTTAKELVNRQHSFGRPVMKAAGSRVLIYSLGGTGYRVESRTKTMLKETAAGNIFCGGIAANGRFALITETDGYCAKLTVYDAAGQELYLYWFSDYYPTAMVLNSDGTKAAVTAVSAKDGGMESVLYLLDIGTPYENGAEPAAKYEENLLLNVYYGRDGTVTAVGDRLTAVVNGSSKKAVEYNYNGMQLLAYAADNGRTALSLAPYASSEGSRFVVLNSSGQEAVRQELSAQAKSVSLYGDTAAALAGGRIVAYSAGTGAAAGEADAGADAAALALCDESSAYVLGISELRLVRFG